MDWVKHLGARAGQGDGWREDFPLDERLPTTLILDARDLGECHPMFLVRLRTFLDWHAGAGRSVAIVPPAGGEARRQFAALRVADAPGVTVDGALASGGGEDLRVVPITRLTDYTQIEDLASSARWLVEYELTDVARLGAATHMALSELCNNALEHGANPNGSYVVAQRFAEPRRRVVIAVSDLGIGIPEHLRQRHPEWHDDNFAIGQAMLPGVSGTGDRYRGHGLPSTIDEALTSAMHAARLDVHAANGFLRTEIVQGTVVPRPFPAARYKRGTWISLELVSV